MRAVQWDKLPDVMCVADLVKVFGCSAKCARELMGSGRFPAVKVGQKWFCSKENVRKFVEEGEMRGTEEGDAA